MLLYISFYTYTCFNLLRANDSWFFPFLKLIWKAHRIKKSALYGVSNWDNRESVSANVLIFFEKKNT